MPLENSISFPGPTKNFLGNLFKKKSITEKIAPAAKTPSDAVVEELEQSLTKEDNLVESNLLIGDKESERKNNKNRKREESLDAQDNDDDKENQDSVNSSKKDDTKDKDSKPTDVKPTLDPKKQNFNPDPDAQSPAAASSSTLLGKMGRFFKRKKTSELENSNSEQLSIVKKISSLFGFGKGPVQVKHVEPEPEPEPEPEQTDAMQRYKPSKDSSQIYTKSEKSSSRRESGVSKESWARSFSFEKNEKSSSGRHSLVSVKNRESSIKTFETKSDSLESKKQSADDMRTREASIQTVGISLNIKKSQKFYDPYKAKSEILNRCSALEQRLREKNIRMGEPIQSKQTFLGKILTFLHLRKPRRPRQLPVCEPILHEIPSEHQKVPDETQKVEELPDDTQKIEEVPDETQKIEEVPDETQKNENLPDVVASSESVEKDIKRPVPKPRKVIETFLPDSIPAEEGPAFDEEESRLKVVGSEHEEDVVHKPSPRRRKRKKASRIRQPSPAEPEPEPEEDRAIKSHESSAADVAEAMNDVGNLSASVIPPDEELLSITVHRSDHLRADLKNISHPVVRVSLVDGQSGNYLTKSSKSRRVTSYYEPDDVTSVLPVMTQPFDFRKNQSVLPRWEETILFNESYESMIAKKNIQIPSSLERVEEEQEVPPYDSGIPAPSPIAFFVIRDFVSMEKANNQKRAPDDVDKGWHTVAWAFLKLVGSDGKPNNGKKFRLQLFHPPRSPTVTSQRPELSEPAFFWWRDHPRIKYPSTLYVTVKPVKAPSAIDKASPGLLALQPEGNSNAYELLRKSLAFGDQSKLEEKSEALPKWNRLPGQTCKLPNTVHLRLWSASDGAFTIQFSNAGLKLAVACKHGSGFPVLVYGIPNGEEMGALIGHQQLVYDIHWSNDDRKLVTSSGDGTAHVWNLNDKSKPSHILPHPAYVYTGAFHPSAQYIVATGGYDAVIRVWSIASDPAQILQELEGHKSFINSIAFDFTHLTLYSVDSSGLLLSWSCHAYEKPVANMKTEWKLKTKFVDKDLTDVCINNIRVHPGNKKLLLHCRDSIIRMFDVRINTSISFTGSVNRHQFLRSAVTPCGTFVMSGSEDGNVYVWNAETADQVAIYNELGFPRAVRDVTFHPHEHMVALCCFSPGMPVLVYRYDKDAANIGGGLSVLSESLLEKIGEVPSGLALDALPPRPASKINKVKRQLDSVLPESEPEEGRSSWFAAKKMLPVSMAMRAFEDQARARIPSPILGSDERSDIPPDQLISPRRSYNQHALATRGPASLVSKQSVQLSPSYFSPHASQESQRMARQYSTLQDKVDHANRLWKPSFTAVGGSPYRNDSTLTPDVTLNVDRSGNKSLRISASPEMKRRKQEYVVALYDYQANRSDELTMVRGDVIKVLYKDGPSWWFGEKRSDMTQGYFPTSYVFSQGEDGIPEETPEVPLVVSEERPNMAENEEPKTVHALKMEGGKVRFYSQSESDGDDDVKKAALSLSSRERRRERRLQTSAPTPPSQPPVPLTSPPSRKLPDLSSDKPTDDESKKISDVGGGADEDKHLDVDGSSANPAPVVESTPKPRKRRKKPHSTSQAEAPVDNEEEFSYMVGSQTWESPPVVRSDERVVGERPRFGVLKAVQAKMAAEDSSFSESVVRGSEFSARPVPMRRSFLDPMMTSQLSKPRKSRLKRNSRKSHVRTHEPLEHDESIPMVPLRSASPHTEGRQNPAYDDVSDL